jgi:uncharacterized protein YbjT (DUF2867 family)
LRETPVAEYAQRTEWNVRDSDGTVIFTASSTLAGGSKLTAEMAQQYGRPCLHLSKAKDGNASTRRLREFIRRHSIKVLNVAGPRFSTEPEAGEFATEILNQLWQAGAF